MLFLNKNFEDILNNDIDFNRSLAINRERNLRPYEQPDVITKYKKKDYPHARDTMQYLLENKIKYRDQNVTGKINSNNFDILRHVSKFDWEKK